MSHSTPTMSAPNANGTAVADCGCGGAKSQPAAQAQPQPYSQASGPTGMPAGEQFVYALGKITVRFPTLSLEKEFQQRERALTVRGDVASPNLPALRTHQVLATNPHLARRVCYVLNVGSIPAYVLMPTGTDVVASLLDGLLRSAQPDGWCLVIGRRMGSASPGTCGGLLAPVVSCDQVHAFNLATWSRELFALAEPILKTRQIQIDGFEDLARDFFEKIALSIENVGGSDTHRALNYLLVQNPGLFLAAAMRTNSVLDKIETRPIQGTESRTLIAVILTFIDRGTAVPERLFCRVDVTEEWPFLADGPEGKASAMGMLPFVENGLVGIPY
jgi:hypothetical protein